MAGQGFLGRKHSEETKEKMRSRYRARRDLRHRSLGIDFSIYDTEKKRKNREEYLLYRLGRKPDKDRVKRYRRNLKARLIEKYGGKCACCGDTHFEFLSLDHKNNDGAEDRRKNGCDRARQLAIQKEIDDNFQLLCMNCNFAKGKYGECPHVRECPQ